MILKYKYRNHLVKMSKSNQYKMEEINLYWIRELVLSMVRINMARSEYDKIL